MPGGDGLGERADVNYLPRVVQRVERGHVLTLEPQVDVAVVLEHRNAVPPGNFQYLFAPLQRHGPAQRVLEGGDGVEVLDLAPLALEPRDGGVQVLGDDAVLVALYAHHVGFVAPQRAQRAQVQELLGQHRVAGIGEGLDDHRDGFARSPGQHHALGVDLHAAAAGQPLRYQPSKLRVSGRVGVVGQVAPLPRQCAAHRIGQPVQRQRVRVGVGDGEIVLCVARLARRHLRHAGGEQSLVAELLWHCRCSSVA